VDVGQGQSIVLTSGGAAAVIDCGGKGTSQNAGDAVSSYLLGQGITSIDALCVTHFDEDHINGVERLMTIMPVGRLIMARERESDTGREEILALAESEGIEVYIVERDTELFIGDIRLLIFEPVSRSEPELIYLASVEEYDILVSGDAGEEAERRLLLKAELPDVEVFVAGHHGSRTSSCMELLRAIKAETAIVSVGYNSYGHPTPETLERFALLGMEVLRTDDLGNVTLSFSR
jgi:competence protein ComEC